VALLEKRRYLNNRSGDFPQVILIVPSHVPNRGKRVYHRWYTNTVHTFSWPLLSFVAESSASGPQSGKAPYYSLPLPRLYIYISLVFCCLLLWVLSPPSPVLSDNSFPPIPLSLPFYSLYIAGTHKNPGIFPFICSIFVSTHMKVRWPTATDKFPYSCTRYLY
jgi:hypothetical protein